MKPCCTGSSSPSPASPSTVRTSWPPAIAASTVHDFTGSPSSQTTQVPQLLVSQPQCVPVRPSSSRRKCTSSSRPSISRVTSSPLTVIGHLHGVTLLRRWMRVRRRGAAPAGQLGGQVALVVRAAALVGDRVAALAPRSRRPGRTGSSDGACPRSAAEIAGMPVVFGPTAASPTRASAIAPPSSQHRGAGRDHGPVAGPALDLLVRAGPAGPHRDADLDEDLAVARRAVSYGPRGTPPWSRPARPRGPRITQLASSVVHTADRSSDGSAWQSEPPSVPRLRTTGSAITRSASRKIGNAAASSSDSSSSRCRVIAPIRTCVGSTLM